MVVLPLNSQLFYKTQELKMHKPGNWIIYKVVDRTKNTMLHCIKFCFKWVYLLSSLFVPESHSVPLRLKKEASVCLLLSHIDTPKAIPWPHYIVETFTWCHLPQHVLLIYSYHMFDTMAGWNTHDTDVKRKELIQSFVKH